MSEEHPVFLFKSLPWDELTKEADCLLKDLFPICRSITGNGVRETLRTLNQIADFNIFEIPTGTKCYDWTVPDEWNIRDAYIETLDGRKVIDFKVNNLHVVNYSIPVDEILTFAELDKHLHRLPDLPDAIPYRTTYYNRNWGFCLTENQYQAIDRQGTYHVCIDSKLAPGSLTYGEALIQGDSGQEFLISTYCCHPSLANDNLSGCVLWALLLRELKAHKTHHSYRFIIIPETIGAIAYLAGHESEMKALAGGLVITTVAGPGQFGYKHTFLENHLVDRVVHQTYRELGIDFISHPFHINGSDETHFSAPFFRIPIGTICKNKYYEYDYYHTSLDNLDFISAENLVQTLKLYLLTIEKLELNQTFNSLYPYSEPMLGKRGLYPNIGGSISQKAVNLNQDHLKREYRISEDNIIYGSELDSIRWVMFFSDGKMSLLDIAERSGFPLKQLYQTAEKLEQHKLLERVK